jgi:hypothetical protein
MCIRRLAGLFAALFAASASPARADDGFDLDAGLRVLPPLKHGQLAVFPVVRAGAPRAAPARYLTLQAGLERKEVAVEEVGPGGSVNNLRIANRSARPLLILGGEIVLGGKQDRVLARDALLAPGEVAVVEVFCVEHGRWSGGRHFGSSGGIADGALRMRAKYGGSQMAVWDHVAKKNSALKAESRTGTYRTLAVGEQGRRATEPYRAAITRALLASEQAGSMVGLVAAVAGKVSSVDLFDSPELFAQYRDSLLDALYLTAASLPDEAPAAPPAPAAVKDFFSSARAAPGRGYAQGAAEAREHSGKSVIGVELRPKAPAKPAASPAPPVYESYQAR